MALDRKKLLQLIGVQLDTTDHREKLISTVGGFLGIFFILNITHFFVPGVAGALIVASMGASAVLLFAVPHGPLSQPWPLIGGHVLSAIIGVSAHLLIDDIFLAGALAVGISIGVMYYLRCIHPPGGATALSAVVGGPAVYALGYQYVLTPVLLNALVILLVALLVNYPFVWRRYPVALAQILSEKKATKAGRPKGEGIIPQRDLEYALRQMRSFADVTEDDLERIYAAARQHSERLKLGPEDIKSGSYYSHGQYGEQLSVRRIIDESRHENPDKDMVIYKIFSGADLYKTGAMTRTAFANWAKHEVVLDDQHWRAADAANDQSELKK